MINFNQLTRIELDDIYDIIDEKYNPQKGELLKLKVVISQCYNDYVDIENSKRLKKINFTDSEKNCLLSLYNSQTKTAQSVIKEIVDNLNPKHESKCLFCGIGEYEEIDHYLPKEHFPQYSILFKNLLPICGKCNKKKGENIPGDKFDYLHLIYDLISLDDYLKLDIIFKTGSNNPILDFQIHHNNTSTLIQKHIEALNLISRYNKKGLQYILRIKALHSDFGEQYAIDELNRNFLETSAYFGANFWKSVLIKKLIDINYVKRYCS